MIDWSKSDPETVREIVREGEAYLHGQLTLATSADQRASVMAGIFTAAGAAIVAGLITLASSKGASSFVPIFAGGIVAAILFLVGAGLCIYAALPVGFNLPGSQPLSWQEDVEKGRKLFRSLREQAENYQDKIVKNRKVLKANAKRFKWGAISGIAAPFLGFLVWLATSFCL